MYTLFLDLSTTSQTSLKTGIERVASTIFTELAKLSIPNYQVVPVYLAHANGRWHYRRASQYKVQVLGCKLDDLHDQEVSPQAGDTLVVMDFSGDRLVRAAAEGLYTQLQNGGVATHAIIYDLLPLKFPTFFPPGTRKKFEPWLESALSLSSVIAISRAVALDLEDYMEGKRSAFPHSDINCQVQWFTLGADFDRFSSGVHLLPYEQKMLSMLGSGPNFLSVGTIEPRKGHLQTLEAFTLLWEDGFDANLVFVGAEGWAHLPSAQRRSIPELASQIRCHPEYGKRLFWFDGVGDGFLKQIYQSSICLLAASEGEGFGLPLIEGAQYGLPILARDIAVFREVLGDHAQYFEGKGAIDLSKAILSWHQLYLKKLHRKPEGLSWSNWQKSALQLLGRLGISAQSN